MNQLTTLLLLLLSGFCFLSSAHHLSGYWVLGRKDRPRLAFATLALAASVCLLPSILLLHAQGEMDVRLALKLDLALFIPMFLNLIWFVDLYSGRAYQRSWFFFLSGGAVLWVIHLFLPYGLVTSGFEGFAELSLPWGETLHFARLTPSVGASVYYIFILSGLVHVTRRGIQLWREKTKNIGIILLGCLAIGWLLAIHDMLLDFGAFSGLYLSTLVVPAFVILNSVNFDVERNQKEALYTELFDSMTDSVFVHDAFQGQVLQVNEAAVRMFGFSREEFAGLCWEDCSSDAESYNSAAGRRAIRRAFEKGPHSVEWLSRRKDGNLFWTEVALRAVRLAGKDRVIAVVRDITERKRNQAELEASEAKFRNIIESSPIGMHFFRLEDGDRLVFEGANQAADRLLGMEHSPTDGMTFEGAFPIWAKTEIPRRYVLAAKEGLSWHSENIFYQDDRLTGGYEIFAVQTKPGSMVAFFYDMSQRLKLDEERRRIQSRLQESQRLESLGVLAGGIAHDFNNMLMAIRGGVDELTSCPGFNTHEDCMKSVELVKTVTIRATELCKQLLAYAGRNAIAPHPIDLRQAVEEIGRVVEAGISKKVRLDYRWVDPLPLVKADPHQIRQVILNLLTNASESFGKEAGRITVSIQPRILEMPEYGLPVGNYLSLEVADNGHGMDAETQERIFEPFFSTKFPGRGLGLAAVQGILRAHGGTIQAKSAPGQGTTMTMLIPVAKEKTATVKKETPTMEGKFAGRVLLVDDEPDVRHVTKRMLEKMGFSVDETGHGLESVSMVRANGEKYSAVIMDLTMPDIDGIEALNRILVLRPNLPLLLITGYGPEETRERLLGMPEVMVLQKPFGREELGMALQRSGVMKEPLSETDETTRSLEALKLDLARLIGTSTDIGEFYHDLSRLFLKLPGIKFAWLGLVGPDGVSVVPVAEGGEGGSYVQNNQFRTDDSSLGRGPTGMTVKSGKTCFVDDIATDPDYEPWRVKALKEGFASSGAVPIMINGQVVGTLNLYSGQKGYFDESRRNFFGEFSLLLAEGFRKLREETKHLKKP